MGFELVGPGPVASRDQAQVRALSLPPTARARAWAWLGLRMYTRKPQTNAKVIAMQCLTRCGQALGWCTEVLRY